MGVVKDLTGLTFGELTVLERDKINPTLAYRAIWSCLCTCGNTKSVRSTDLLTGQTRSCGKKSLHYSRESSALWRGYGDISQACWGRIKNNAKSRGIQIELSIEEAWNVFLSQNSRCALSGVLLTFDSLAACRDGNASLDRIDSSRHYTVDNVQWVHKMINRCKLEYSEQEFIEMCKRVAKYRQ